MKDIKTLKEWFDLYGPGVRVVVKDDRMEGEGYDIVLLDPRSDVTIWTCDLTYGSRPKMTNNIWDSSIKGVLYTKPKPTRKLYRWMYKDEEGEFGVTNYFYEDPALASQAVGGETVLGTHGEPIEVDEDGNLIKGEEK